MSIEKKTQSPYAGHIFTTNDSIKEDTMTAAITNPTVTEAQNINTNDSIQEEAMTSAVYTQAATAAQKDNLQIIYLPIDTLAVPLSHPRRDKGNMDILKKSIESNDLIEPLTVCKSEDGKYYFVIDGTRRLTVLAELKRASVPCIVMESMPAGKIAHASYVKNAERQNLNIIEIAMHLKAMKDKYGYSLRDLNMKGYGSPATIGNQIKLLKLPEIIVEKLRRNELTISHGLSLLKLDSKQEQVNWGKLIVTEGLSASKAEKKIADFIEKGNHPKPDSMATSSVVPRLYSKDSRDMIEVVPCVYIKDSRDMIEVAKESVHLIVTGAPRLVLNQWDSPSIHWDKIRSVMEECDRVLVPGGVIAINIVDTMIRNQNKANTIVAAMHRYQSLLKKHNIYLTDVIHWVAPQDYRNAKALKGLSEETRHTTYSVQSFHSSIYIFRKPGERESQVDDIVRRSRLNEKDWSDWCSGIWEIQTADDGEYPETFPEELPRRIIKMFSFEGDTVLDPFLGTGTTVKVARELHREGIGYEREIKYKPVIMKKLGLTEDTLQPETMLG
ncbi:MAG: DNA methyltransferase, partial [Bacteroidales bacterium]